VGKRLAAVALAKTYGDKKLVYSGPRFKSFSTQGNKATISFTFADGLKSSDGQALGFFSVAGTDGKFSPAQAKIENGKVIVWSDDVPLPAAVRYGWTETATPNLVNSAGLPAFPFNTTYKSWTYEKP
jgi:sialate O-acetylesterase